MINIYLKSSTGTINKSGFSGAVVLYPENGKSGEEIQKYVENLSTYSGSIDFHIITDSLYLLRETYLQSLKCTYYNLDTGLISHDLDSIGAIAVLDRDLEQSERYMNFELHVS